MPANGDKVRKIKMGKFGLAEDPRQLHIMMTHKGQDLLGEVTGAYQSETGLIRLQVRHFCGDPWPVEPSARLVDVLVRDS